MKWVLYNALFLAVYPFLLPGFVLRMIRRGGYMARMGDRFALYPPGVVKRLGEGERPVWIHAVSVGEVQVAGQLMREWREADPSIRFCFSTTSSTGWKMAERELGDNDILIYNPLDFPTFVTAALKLVRPRSLIMTESEIWPNFIRRAAKMKIPIFLINARISDRSAPRYRAARFFFRDVFSLFTRIFAQSDLDRDRLLAAGAPADSVEVTGSFKFDVANPNPEKEEEMRRWISAPQGARVILGASTWPGEDEALLKIYSRLINISPANEVVLVIAPRHFEKADRVEENILKAGFGCIRRSRRGIGDKPRPLSPTVYLADTTGELVGLCGAADIVFVGKSLTFHGSQNMIEPCSCGKTVLVGPNTENFRPVMSDLLSANAIVQVADEEELAKKIAGFVKDDEGFGRRASEAVARRKGVVGKCVSAIRGLM